MITKHCILRNAPGIALLRHVHAALPANVADVTASFRHYKFVGDYIGRDKRQVAQRIWQHGEDEQRRALYDRPGGFSISTPAQKVYRGVEALAEEGFIQKSARFDAFLKRL